MQVYIHYAITEGPWGGGNSFLRALRDWLLRQSGISLVDEPDSKTDIVLLNGAHNGPSTYIDVRWVKGLRRRGLFRRSGPRIVYRLDGFRSIYAQVNSQMDQLQLDLLKLTHHVIFQTEQCAEDARSMGAELTRYDVIHNAVDGNVFYPDADRGLCSSPLRVMAASWSPNVRKGHALFSELSLISDVRCDFYGNWPENVSQQQVTCYPPLERAAMAEAYRSHDVFFHGAIDDPCPNVICEALASGLPVICLNSGGAPDLVDKHGLVLPVAPTKEQLAEAVATIRQTYIERRQGILHNRSRWTMDSVGLQYLEVFRKVIG